MRRASRLASAPPRSVAARAVAVAFAQSMATAPGSAAAVQPHSHQSINHQSASLAHGASTSLTQRRSYHISMALADVEEADDDEPLPEHPLHGKAFTGEVSAWHFVDRRGSIAVPTLDDATKASNGGSLEFTIKAAGAFESLMPTAHRNLVGTTVTFVVGFHGEATQVIIDASSLKRPADQVRAPPVLGKRDIRSEAVSNESYAELRKKAEDEKARRLEERKSGSVTITGALARVVCPAVMSGKIANWSKIHRTGLVTVEREGEVALHYVVQSAHDFVDATPSSLNLVGATVEFRPVHTHRIANATEVHEATLAQMGGTSAEGKEAARRDEATRGMAPTASSLPMNVSLGECTNMVAEDIRVLEFPVPVSEAEKAEAAKAAEEFVDVNETLLEDEGPHFGVITRWSGGQGTLESGDARVFFIEGVASFASFDPNQSSIRGAVVQFEQNTRSPRYAHSIVILSEVSTSGGVSDSNSSLPSQQYSLNVIDTKDFDARVLSDVDYSEAVEDSNVDGATIEDGIADANPDAPLSKLPMWGKRAPVKSTSSSNADMVRSDAGTVRTTPKKTTAPKLSSPNAVAPSTATTAVPATGTAAGSDDDPFAHLPVQRGTLSTFSKRESTGIVVDDETGSRYVLRDASKDVVGYRARAVQDAFEKGCAVSFVAVGVSGRVATRVRVEKTRKGDEFDTERKVELEDKHAAEDKADKASASDAVDEEGNAVAATAEADDEKGCEIATENDEAVASPVAKDYWLRRFERVGANMTEYRKQVESLKPPEPDDQLDDYCADDPWFKDPQRNKKVRGEATVGDMFKIAPANLMHLAMQGAQDPAKIHKDAKKLEKRLPDEYRMKAREEAKRAAPEFLKAMQQTRERSGEKAFNFYT